MLTLVVGGIMAGVVTALVVSVAIIVGVLSQPPKYCPNCCVSVPKFRMPANLRQLLWGGWTCHICGCEMDRHARKLPV